MRAWRRLEEWSRRSFDRWRCDAPVLSRMSVAERVRRMRSRDRRHTWLWSQIENGLARRNLDRVGEWEFVQLLRSWAYANIRRQTSVDGEAVDYLDVRPDFAFYSKEAPDIFRAFYDDVGGVIGGGNGYALMTLYRAFGFDAAIIDCGEPAEGFTRISVVCEIDHAGQRMWVVQDPNYDFGLGDRTGEPISFFDVLALLRDGRHQDIKVMCGDPGAYRYIIVHPAQLAKLANEWTIDPRYPGSQPVRVLADGRLVFKAQMAWRNYERLADASRAFLKRRGLPEELVYFYRLVFAVYPAHEEVAQMLLARAKEVLRLQ